MASAEIRVLTLGEVEKLVDWAADEGWNPGSEDAAAFRAVDPQGFIGCLVDGRLAAGISAVSYGGFGFIGLYICHPDLRGRGLGRHVHHVGLALRIEVRERRDHGGWGSSRPGNVSVR